MPDLRKTRAIAILGLCSFLLGGCSTMGNVFVGHHDNSMVQRRERTQVLFCKGQGDDATCTRDTEVAAVPALALAQAIPLVLGAVHKGMEAESRKYGATYSGRGSGILFACKDQREIVRKTEQKKPDGTTTTTTRKTIVRDVDRRVDTIRLERTYRYEPSWWGRVVRGEKEGERTAVRLDLAVKIADADQAWMILRPVELRYEKAKAKVAWFSWWPWRWLTDLVLGPWVLIDDDVVKVDLNAQVELTAITAGKALSLGTIDFPLGKQRIDRLGRTIQPMEKKGTPTSGYLPLPSIACTQEVEVPLNVRVTFMEANDLGDVIAKGADLLDQNKDKVSEGLGGLVSSD